MRTEELLALGVFGKRSRLGERIEMLLERGRESSPRISRVWVAASSTALVALVAIASLGPRALAFAEEPLRFEVASVRPTNPNVIEEVDFAVSPGGRLTVTNLSLGMLIAAAYGLEEYQIVGGPQWTRSSRFDIAAKATAGVDSDSDRVTVLKRDVPRKMTLMLQSLLADRFHLQLHREMKQGETYTLAAAKSGPRLQQAKESDQPPYVSLRQGKEAHAIAIRGRRGTMPLLAERLSVLLRAPVADRTGIAGEFDFEFEYSPNSEQPDGGPSLFTAIQDLGLRLETQKGQVETLVIDRVEMPSEN